MAVATDKLASEYRIGTELEFWKYEWAMGGPGGLVVRRTYTRLDHEGIAEKAEREQGVSWKTRKENPALWFRLEYNLAGRVLNYSWLTDDRMDEEVLHRRHQTKESACRDLDKALHARLQSAEEEVDRLKQRIVGLAPHLAEAPAS